MAYPPDGEHYGTAVINGMLIYNCLGHGETRFLLEDVALPLSYALVTGDVSMLRTYLEKHYGLSIIDAIVIYNFFKP